MSKAIFQIVLVLFASIFLYWALSSKIEREIAKLEQRQSNRVPNVQGGIIAAASTTQELLSQMRENCDQIPGFLDRPDLLQQVEIKTDELQESLQGQGEEALPVMVEDFQKPGSLEYRRRLLRLIGKMDLPQGFALADATFHNEAENINVRWASAYVMADLDAKRATAILADFLLTHTGEYHQGMSYLVDALKQIGTYEVEQTLLKVALDAQKEAAIRHRAVDALGELRVVEAIPHLQGILRDEANGYLRRNATRALYAIQGSEACKFLRSVLADEQNAEMHQFLHNFVDRDCK